MEGKTEKGLDEFIEKIKDYLNAKMKLSKLTIIEKGVLLFANVITNGFVIVFLILAFLFGSLGLSFYISNLMGDTFSGFFIVAFAYFLIALVAYLLKDKYIENKIINALIKKIFKDDDGEDFI